ncbi:MAG: hypothetical protein E7292_08815 [Lachnospiraceae bacterium]|nr:hypothetical protein [Lachnospiraceae bacterium]
METDGKRSLQEKEQSEQLDRAMKVLEEYVHELAAQAGESEEYAADLWSRIVKSNGVLRELAYYHDYGKFWGEYKVAGYSITDILVWQVDHFKAYLDRREEVNRWQPEKLFLKALDTLLLMETDPQPIVDKLQGETGTDYVGKFKEY